MNIESLADALLSSNAFAGYDVQRMSIPGKVGVFREPGRTLHPRLSARLSNVGVNQLFSHQATAFDLVCAGKDLMITAGTNSGKSLCFNLPVLDALLREPNAHALYLFPTKSLAHDQLQKLEQLSLGDDIRFGTFDGDTGTRSRSLIRNTAHIIFTNPDMLHATILPKHEMWSKFLRSLRFVVIDEAHVYRGLFGAHTANILRRLLRLCAWHGSRPQIIACSATIANPQDHFRRLTSRDCEWTGDDGSEQSGRQLFIASPAEAPYGFEPSPNRATATLLACSVQNGAKSLAFNRSRFVAELVLKQSRKESQIAEALDCYRGGYSPVDRRKLEKNFRNGKLLGLSTTSAMELGIDIGDLDVAILNGFPGSIASFRQQVARAGRGHRPGLAIWIAHTDPLELFYAAQPQNLAFGCAEPAVFDEQNRNIMSDQLRCAAYERAIGNDEIQAFGTQASKVISELFDAGAIEFRANRYYYPSFESPASRVNIRGLGGDRIKIVTSDSESLGDMELWRAMQFAHPGAVYLHRGQSYLISELNVEAGEAIASHSDCSYYTRAAMQSIVRKTVEIEGSENGFLICGVEVTTSVNGFSRVNFDGDTCESNEVLELSPLTFNTIGIEIHLPIHASGEALTEAGIAAHSVEHALLHVAPFLAGCEKTDLGSAWYVAHPQTLRPVIYIFDMIPGGAGICAKLYERREEWLNSAELLLQSCRCEIGCPRCLFRSNCESGNRLLNKQLGQSALDSLQSGNILELKVS